MNKVKIDQWAIFDMDGTLADGSHRLHHIKNMDADGNFIAGRKDSPDWDAYNSKMSLDLPKWNIIALAQMCYDRGILIAVVTGRQELYYKETVEWLRNYHVPFDQVHMRPTGDYRSDFVVKQEIYDNHFKEKNIVFAVDDRQQVVDMWRRNGLTCLQCQKGDY